MFDYIIVQAGGKGTRLKHLTANKPKALVSINNLPMIFYLFKKFPDKKFIVIGDYKFDVLKKYLETFAEVDFEMVNANGKTGTLSGLNKALEKIPESESFMLIWSDLILDENLKMPNKKGNFIGISKEFPCRWRFVNNHFEEVSSSIDGVAGMFVFENKSVLTDLPEEGEFVRYLSTKSLKFKTIPLTKTKEYGLLDVVNNVEKPKCRPFNKMTVEGNKVIKEPITQQGKELAEKEINWYKFINDKGCSNINLPKIYSFDPLVMEKISVKSGGGEFLPLFKQRIIA